MQSCCRSPTRVSVSLLQGGTVVNHDQQFEADVLIEGDRIVDVSSGIQVRR